MSCPTKLNVALGVGEKIQAGWKAFHGAGEGIRGNVNVMLDNVGEQLAGRGNANTNANTHVGGAKPATMSDGGQRPEAVAAKGADEFKEGMDGLKK